MNIVTGSSVENWLNLLPNSVTRASKCWAFEVSTTDFICGKCERKFLFKCAIYSFSFFGKALTTRIMLVIQDLTHLILR
jgi:hypothetical protein